MHDTDILGLAAGTLTTAAFLPQVIRTLRLRSAREISLGWIVTFTAGVALWLVYGLRLGSWPIITANAVTLVLTGLILVLKLRWR